MSSPGQTLLSTKLYIPETGSLLVDRPRLRQKLDEAAESGTRLILVAAPAGFGKSTLVARWLHLRKTRTAWVSLDEADNDPKRLITYLASALETFLPGIFSETRLLLAENSSILLENCITLFVNELSELKQPAFIVLDDYHIIQNGAIHDALGLLVERLPSQVSLLLLTRIVPPLPVARLRSRRQLVEIRASDLRFNFQETSNFLNQINHLDLEFGEVQAIEERTEGWIAGLQLAALAMLSDENPDLEVARKQFIQSFSGSHEFVMDYLAEEVFNHQSETLQEFLLKTSILNRFCSPLCDAVTGRDDSDGLITELYRLNLFLIPLDSERHWYRYHHLFSDLLRARLNRKMPQAIPSLHQRASAWFAKEGFLPEAMAHTLAAKDFATAADLVEATWVPLMHTGEITTVLAWLRSLPEPIFAGRPLLHLAFCWGLCLTGQFKEVPIHIQSAESTFDSLQAAGKIPPGDELPLRLPCEMHLIKCFLARNEGKWEEAVEHAQQAIPLAEKVNVILQGNSYTLLGHSYREMGKIKEAIQAYQSAIPLALAGGNHVAALGSYSALGRLQALQGHLHLAEQACQDGLKTAKERGLDRMHAAAILHLSLAEIYLEWNQLAKAEEAFHQAEQIGRFGGTLEYIRLHAVLHARLELAKGDAQDALTVIENALKEISKLQSSQTIAELQARRAGLWIQTGNLAEAITWSKTIQPSYVSLTSETQALYLARVQIAARQATVVLPILESALKAFESSQHFASTLQALILRGVAYQQLENIAAAQSDLLLALKMAQPDNYTRVFLDEGPSLIALLEQVAKKSASDYAKIVLGNLSSKTVHPQVNGKKGNPPELVEPLTERELEVLHLICEGNSNQQIADRLVLSLATIKKHTSSILGKLEVDSRTQAIARARQLQLV